MRGLSDGLEFGFPVSTLPPVERGTVTVLLGCMFSGKTTELLRRIRRYPASHVLAVKHRIDTRYSANHIVSHSGLVYPALALGHAGDIPQFLTGATRIIAIDEVHFFDDELVDVTLRLANRGVHVVSTSLHPDSWGKPFPLGERLRAIADEPITLFAKCARCGAKADRTQRLTPITGDNMVGGPESSDPRCQRCWSPPPGDLPQDGRRSSP